uniref:Uncharacterized protein n=1 Tax=Coccidioides posadasii RMSCC 3488 TaxID=454284 RepID=A0A0J6FEU2_COCPO|nr:hypothetical protein CPAG_03753 [Coccidioides posadasii RMSCC 3488]
MPNGAAPKRTMNGVMFASTFSSRSPEIDASPKGAFSRDLIERQSCNSGPPGQAISTVEPWRSNSQTPGNMPQINLEGLKVSGFILSRSILENVILGTSAKSPFPRAMPCEISGEEIAIVLQLLVGRPRRSPSTQQLSTISGLLVLCSAHSCRFRHVLASMAYY